MHRDAPFPLSQALDSCVKDLYTWDKLLNPPHAYIIPFNTMIPDFNQYHAKIKKEMFFSLFDLNNIDSIICHKKLVIVWLHMVQVQEAQIIVDAALHFTTQLSSPT